MRAIASALYRQTWYPLALTGALLCPLSDTMMNSFTFTASSASPSHAASVSDSRIYPRRLRISARISTSPGRGEQVRAIARPNGGFWPAACHGGRGARRRRGPRGPGAAGPRAPAESMPRLAVLPAPVNDSGHGQTDHGQVEHGTINANRNSEAARRLQGCRTRTQSMLIVSDSDDSRRRGPRGPVPPLRRPAPPARGRPRSPGADGQPQLGR